jgi:hypothetical protein
MALPNPTVWYEFENESLVDSSGNGYTGTIAQAHWGDLQWGTMDTEGVGGAVGPQPFTGSYSPCVLTPYRGWEGYSAVWTFSMWVKTEVVDYANNSQYFCAFGRYNNAAIIQVVYVKSNKRIYFNTYNLSTYMTDAITPETELMLTYRYNGDEGASSTVDCFVNGEFYITHNIGERMSIFSSQQSCIDGGEGGHGTFLSSGLVGDFRWYDSILTNGQISDLYGLFGPPPEILVGNTIVGGLTTN